MPKNVIVIAFMIPYCKWDIFNLKFENINLEEPLTATAFCELPTAIIECNSPQPQLALIC